MWLCSTLWIEEASHPEDIRATLEAPGVELGIPLQQLSEPEAQGGRLPGHLPPQGWHAGIVHVVQRISQILYNRTNKWE